MAITRAITVLNKFEIGPLYEALLSSNIPVQTIRSTFSKNGQIAIDYDDLSTAQQRGADTDAVVSRFDSTNPIAYIDAKVTGARLIAVINGAATLFFPYRARVVCRSANAITVPATMSIGTNAPNYNNVYAAGTLTGLTQLGDLLNLPVLASTKVVSQRVAVYANITVAAVGTAQLLRVDLIGDYEAR